MKCMKSIMPKKIFNVSDINIVITKNSVDKYLIFIVLSTFHVAESTAGVFGQIPGI
jgi:RAB protein geranylgeranyltransferase component A